MNDPKGAKSATNFLKGFHEISSIEAFGSRKENRDRLRKVQSRRFTQLDDDKFKDFKKTVTKYNSFINLKSLISGLDDEKTALDTAKIIFVLFNQALPYYSSEIRCCFDLEQLFVEFEKIHHPLGITKLTEEVNFADRRRMTL